METSPKQSSLGVSESSPRCFLSLPPEIRNKIYELALVADHALDLWPDRYVKDYGQVRRNCPRKHYEHICKVTRWCTCGDHRPSWQSPERERVLDCPHHKAIKQIEETGAEHRDCWIGTKWEADMKGAPFVINYGWSKLGYMFHSPRIEVHWKLWAESQEKPWSPIYEDACRLQPLVKCQRIFVRDQQDLRYIRKQLATGLLSTCSQVRAEASPYFWRENDFGFSGNGGWYGLLRFLLTIDPAARKSKNEPKLHMVKIPTEGRNKLSTIRQACQIMLQDNVVRRIILMMPYRCYTLSRDSGWQALLRTQQVLQGLALTQIVLCVDSGAFLGINRAVHRMDYLEWYLYCRPSSYIGHPHDPRHYAWELQDTELWGHDKYGYLEGLPSLFGAADEEFSGRDQWKGVTGAFEEVPLYEVLEELTVRPILQELME
ncbi:MAG: hypothetical protein Q9225_002801 [Loekoesia sp. 1 TL-2023]